MRYGLYTVSKDIYVSADIFCNAMSDSKYRNNVPPHAGTTRDSSTPQRVSSSARASQPNRDAAPGMRRPNAPASNTPSDTMPHQRNARPAKPTDESTVKMPTLRKPQPTEQNQSGRVKFDSRGNPVWEWQTSTGVFESDISEEDIHKQASELSLAATQPVPVIANKKTAKPEPKQKVRSSEDTGFNPYDADNVTKTRGPNKQASHPALAHIANKKPSTTLKPIARRAAEQPKPQGFWDKLKSKFS